MTNTYFINTILNTYVPKFINIYDSYIIKSKNFEIDYHNIHIIAIIVYFIVYLYTIMT